MLIASHISAENTSRTVRAPSRARVTQLSTEVGCSGSSVSMPSTSSRDAGLSGGSPETIVTQVAPGEPHAGRVVGPRLHVGVEDAVEHARGVLGARQLAADPVQLVGDPRRAASARLASLLLLLLLLAGPTGPG